MGAQQLALVKIWVSDIDAAERFYEQSLGLKRKINLDIVSGGMAAIERIMAIPSVGSDGADIALVQYKHHEMPQAGPSVLLFMVDDVEASLAAMIAGGGRCMVPVQEIAAHGVKVAFATDLDGNIIEIMENLG